jgi:hypothetical protein
MPDLPPEPAGEDLPALVAALRAANARLREVIEAKDAQLAAAGAALEAAEARFAELSELACGSPSGRNLQLQTPGGILGAWVGRGLISSSVTPVLIARGRSGWPGS